MPGLVDDPHAAAAELALDLETGDDRKAEWRRSGAGPRRQSTVGVLAPRPRDGHVPRDAVHRRGSSGVWRPAVDGRPGSGMLP